MLPELLPSKTRFPPHSYLGFSCMEDAFSGDGTLSTPRGYFFVHPGPGIEKYHPLGDIFFVSPGIFFQYVRTAVRIILPGGRGFEHSEAFPSWECYFRDPWGFNCMESLLSGMEHYHPTGIFFHILGCVFQYVRTAAPREGRCFQYFRRRCHPGIFFRVPWYFGSAVDRPALPTGQWFEPRVRSIFFFFLYRFKYDFSPFFSDSVFAVFYYLLPEGIFAAYPFSTFFVQQWACLCFFSYVLLYQ